MKEKFKDEDKMVSRRKGTIEKTSIWKRRFSQLVLLSCIITQKITSHLLIYLFRT